MIVLALYWFKKIGIIIITTSSINPVGIYLLKVNNRNTRTRCETC